jgi:MerR family transcriptional regulator, mercuric resistance operon regulatory protein
MVLFDRAIFTFLPALEIRLTSVAATDSSHFLRGKFMADDEMQIGALSRRTGCNIETIRYYERIGLLPNPSRSGRYRRYLPADVARLKFVRRARELGFKLDEVRVLLRLATADGASTCAEVRQLAASHLIEVEAKLADLRAMKRALSDAVRRCDLGQLPRCPLIDALAGR